MNKTKDEAALSLFRLLFSFIVRYTTTLYCESLFRQNHYAEPPNMLTGHWPSFLRMSNSCTAFSGNPTFYLLCPAAFYCFFLLFLVTAVSSHDPCLCRTHLHFCWRHPDPAAFLPRFSPSDVRHLHMPWSE